DHLVPGRARAGNHDALAFIGGNDITADEVAGDVVLVIAVVANADAAGLVAESSAGLADANEITQDLVGGGVGAVDKNAQVEGGGDDVAGGSTGSAHGLP